ncbi:MAG TPA: FAD-binding oxidoreductase [Burkholderiales bacterium]|nr:FAD-binding oxidoreductase [Burkholderiales bacterium]
MNATDLVAHFAKIVGDKHVLTDAGDTAAYATDWRKRYLGTPLAVVRPGTTAEVAGVVKACAETRTAIVPQGGNTGLCGGATPDASGNQVIVSLGRMNRIRAIDPLNNTMTVEAGCVLASLQHAADEADRLFPLSLAAEGSCAIGGNLSTNAGGVQVLRYGNTRELVLGLEVVLPSGEVWNGLRGLRKDNTGYDLKHLFVGAEGTLGIITAAVLKLFPKPRAQATAVAALATPRDALRLLEHVHAHCGDRLTGFELISAICIELVRKHFPRVPAPFAANYPQYALIELSDTQGGTGVGEMLEATLAEAIESGVALDAVVAASGEQAKNLWGLREYISEAQAAEGQNIKHDISIPISRIGDFIDATDAKLARVFPGIRMVTFGHLGDGNLHYNVSHPEDGDEGAFIARSEEVNRVVHDSVAAFGGSISAEHGIGQYKRGEILRYKSPVEIELMRAVKRAVDPLGIMNPGKVL